ncbi:MAG TPA: hypothetical protein VG815_15905, partial [Chloroflexota bacterium]|nr:hypothetical protein [Chloroflexota bacterium]
MPWMEGSKPWSGARDALRAGPVLLVAVGLVCLIARSAPAASSARASGREYGNPDTQILVTYSGHLHRRTPLGSKGALRFGYVDVTLDWTATATFPSQDTFQRGVALHFTKLTGKIMASGVGNPEPKVAPIVDCEATLSERAGVEQSSADQRATTLYDLPTSRYRMSGYSPPLSAYMLQSTDKTPPGHDLCSLNPTLTGAVGSEQWPGPAEGTPAYAAYVAAWDAYDTFPGGTGPFRNYFDDTWSSADGLDIAEITSTITATNELNVSPHNTPYQVRAWAQRHWRSLIPIYDDVLLWQNIQLVLLKPNLVLVATSRDSPALRRYVTSVVFENDLLLKTFREINASFEKTLALLEEAYNDPPLSGVSSAPVEKVTPFRFQPSSCTGITQRSRGFCTRLEQDAATWIDAGATLEALARALATDVGREGAAGSGTDKSAIASLEQAELALLPRLTAAWDAQQQAGARFGAALRGIGVDIGTTARETAAGIARFLAGLEED